MSTDPITAAVNDIGRLAIHITCNDIASNGVQPLGIMLAVMLPEGTTEARCGLYHGTGRVKLQRNLSVEIIGGHTEITPAVKAAGDSIDGYRKSSRQASSQTGERHGPRAIIS